MEPSFDELRSLIMLAGGEVLQDKPPPRFVVECIQVINFCSFFHYFQFLDFEIVVVFSAITLNFSRKKYRCC